MFTGSKGLTGCFDRLAVPWVGHRKTHVSGSCSCHSLSTSSESCLPLSAQQMSWNFPPFSHSPVCYHPPKHPPSFFPLAFRSPGLSPPVPCSQTALHYLFQPIVLSLIRSSAFVHSNVTMCSFCVDSYYLFPFFLPVCRPTHLSGHWPSACLHCLLHWKKKKIHSFVFSVSELYLHLEF